MTSISTCHQKTFISYSHDSPEHDNKVLEFSNRLRADGVDCILDQYEFSPPEGWPRWMDRNIGESDFVLMICTESYCKRVMGEEKKGTGLGVRWEGKLIYQHIYNAGSDNNKFIPILFNQADTSQIPIPLQPSTYYCVYSPQDYEDLYRRLTNQPKSIKSELGKLRKLPRLERKQEFFLPPWNVPYERNPYFTGRDKIIQELHDALRRDRVGAKTQAISGLGGIGKTQIAVEYAYRYRKKHAAVFWVRAGNHLDLDSSFLEIAEILGLPEKDDKDTKVVVLAIKHWLECNGEWLLIFDNADEPELIKAYRPLNASGHVLLTSRAQVFQTLGISIPILVNEMTPNEALGFLCKRTGRDNNDESENDAAKRLVHEFGFFPLAIEQAGAYITQNQVRFQDYLTAYDKRRLEIMEDSAPVVGYNKSVATTWVINFDQVKNASCASADLLYFSAFIGPDSIPLEMIQKGASQLGPSLSSAINKAKDEILGINTTLEPLTRYSLILKDINRNTYSIHRLVQEVIQHGMKMDARRIWAERTVRAIDAAFPIVEYNNWPLCDRVMPHAEAAATLVKEFDFSFYEAANLLDHIGVYLSERAKYSEAEPVLKYALTIFEKVLGVGHPGVASSLNNLAMLYYDQGRYSEAEQLHKRALNIREKVLGSNDPNLAQSLNNLGALYCHLGKYTEAAPLYERALAIDEKTLGTEHLDLAKSINNLGVLYYFQGKYDQAEQLYKRALNIYEKLFGNEHLEVGRTLNNLAVLYFSQGKYNEAEPLYKHVLSIYEKVMGTEHPDVARSLNNLALLYTHQDKNSEAESLYKLALVIYEKELGMEHPDTATCLHNLAELYYQQKRYSEAEPLYKRSLWVREKILAPEHPDFVQSLKGYANLLRKTNRSSDASKLEAHASALIKK